MEYSNFCRMCAKYGHINQPLSETDYLYCILSDMDDEDLYNMVCDINNGAFDSVKDAIAFYKESLNINEG